MILPAPMRTPLSGTAAVVLILALIAMLLLRVTQPTAAPPKAPSIPLPSEEHATGSHFPHERLSAVVRLRLLTNASRLTLSDEAGRALLALHDLPAGESEHEIQLPMAMGQASLILEADFPQLAGETAVFITLMPDHHEDRSAHAIGGQTMRDTLQFVWDSEEESD